MRRKHLFYLGSDRLDAWLHGPSGLTGPASFAATRAGVDAFIDYMERTQPGTPALLLADLVEEDFQRLLLPHASGKAGRNLLERRLQQQYRETPYRQATIQGRTDEGRRDDIVLCSALTNPLLLQPWIEALELLKVPLAGVYSVPLLSEELVDRLELGREHEHLLLATQETAGLRQSYFHFGQLKFSRLTLAPDREGAAVNAGAETARTQQFLVSVRLLERGDVLHAVMVAQARELERWSAQCDSGPETVYHFLPLQEAAGLAGLDADAPPHGTAPLADALFLELLAKTRPASHYQLGDSARYYRLWQARQVLATASGVLASCALVWVLVNLWAFNSAWKESDRLSLEAAAFDASYRLAMSDMPPSLAPTANMKAAVIVERMLATQAPAPIDMMGMLSAALDKVPQVRIVRLEWRVAADTGAGAGSLPGVGNGGAPAAAPGGMSAPGPGTAMAGATPFGTAGTGRAAVPGTDAALAAVPIPSGMLGIPTRPAQTLRVEAELPHMLNNTRVILDGMNRFAQELARNASLTVEIERPALDISPDVSLNGRTGADTSDKPARFVLNLTLKP